MKLGARSISILKNFNSINESLVFKAGQVQVTRSPGKTILANAKFDEDFPQDFAIHDLAKFLATLSLFTEPELKFKEKHVEITTDKNKVKFTYSNPELIASPKTFEIKMPSDDVEFELSHANLQATTKAMAILGLNDFSIKGAKGRLTINASDSENPSGDTYSIDIGKTNKNFEVIFNTDNLKLMPDDYNVSISSAGISQFVGQGTGVRYWIAIEEKSTFESQ